MLWLSGLVAGELTDRCRVPPPSCPVINEDCLIDVVCLQDRTKGFAADIRDMIGADTLPPRSTSEKTISLPAPPMLPDWRLLRCLFFSLPPTKVSSTSTALPGPPKAAFGFASRIAFADAMGHEPRGVVGDDRACGRVDGRKCPSCWTHIRCGGQQPFMQRDMRALVSSASANGKFLAAIVAMMPAGAFVFAS